jgi:hypothetical protein
LNETNRTEIIDGLYGKLSALTQDKIQAVLVTKVNQEEEDSGKEKIRNDRGMRKEDITPVKYENKTEVKDNIKQQKHETKSEGYQSKVKDNITPMKHENKTEVKEDRRINRQED